MITSTEIKALDQKLIGKRNPDTERGIKDALMDTNNTMKYIEDSTAQIMYRIGQVRAERWKDRDAQTARRMNDYKTTI